MLVNGHLHSQRVKGAVCNLSCQAYLLDCSASAGTYLMYCRHSKQRLYVVIYQGCGKLLGRHQCVKLLGRPLSPRCYLTKQQAFRALPVCQAFRAATVHYTASF